MLSIVFSTYCYDNCHYANTKCRGVFCDCLPLPLKPEEARANQSGALQISTLGQATALPEKYKPRDKCSIN